jgi:membrane-associated phospholipid phosphatase
MTGAELTKKASCFALGLLVAIAPAGRGAAEDLEESATAAAASAPSPFESPRPRLRLWPALGQDFRRLARGPNLLMLGLGSGLSLAAHPYDHRLTSALHRSPSLAGTFGSGKVLGGAYVQGGLALAAVAAGKLSGSQELRGLGFDLVRAQIVAQTLTQGVKFTAGRTRPDGTRLSFPSGHTAATFATAGVLQGRYGWKAGVPAYALASFVGVSRMQANRHFASDVLFGAAIGLTAGRTVTFGHRNARFAIVPTVVPGGLGVAVTKLPRSVSR